MNESRKEEIVNKLTKEHKDTLKQWAEDADKELKELVSDFCELYNKQEAEEAYGDNEDERINYAMNATRARVANEMATPTEDVELYVLGISPPREIENDDGSTNTVSSVFGIGATPSFDSLKVIEVTGWGDESQKVNELEYGNSFVMNISRQGKSRETISYQFESHTEVEEEDFEPEDIPELLKQFYPKVDIAKVREHESTGPNDYKMVRGIIEDINFLSKSDDGRQMARVEIMDNSLNPKDVAETGLFSVMIPADMCRFGPDSDVCFIGNINIDEEYGPGMFASGLAPVIGYEHEQDMSEVSEEELTIEDADEAVAEEEEGHDELI